MRWVILRPQKGRHKITVKAVGIFDSDTIKVIEVGWVDSDKESRVMGLIRSG